jgi:hypothetical protein
MFSSALRIELTLIVLGVLSFLVYLAQPRGKDETSNTVTAVIILLAMVNALVCIWSFPW